MTETHWKKLTDTNFLGSWDVIGGSLILTIARVKQERIFNQNKNAEESCIVAYFTDEKYKPMILNKTNCKAVQKVTGTPFIEKWAGFTIEIKTEKVKAFGELVEALRVSKTAPAQKAQASMITCADCGKPVSAFGQITAAQVAATNKARYGREICADCSTKLKEAAARATEQQ